MLSLRKNLVIIFCLISVVYGFSGFAQDTDEFYETSLNLYKRGLFSDALVALNRGMTSDSSKSDYFLLRAKINYKLGKYDASISDCYQALEIEPNKPEVYFLRGQLCQVTKSYGGAILFFGKTLKFSQDDILTYQSYYNRGNAYLDLGKYNEAYTDLSEAFNMRQDDVGLLYSIAQTYYKLGKSADALTIIEKIVSLEERFGQAYELRGRIAIDNKQYAEALVDLEKFGKINPTEPKAFNLLAETYLNLKEYDKALFNINTCINLQPANPDSYRVKGLIYLAQKQKEEGCNNLFKALQMGYLDNIGYDILDVYISNCESE